MKPLKHVAQHLSPLHGWTFKDEKVPHTIYLKAEKGWALTGYDPAGLKVRVPLPAGEYALEFPVHSVNLSVLVIDPDPGGGGLLE